MDLWSCRRSETISLAPGGSACHRSIANTAIKTAAGTRTKSGKSNPPKRRSRRRLLARAQCRCRAHIRFPVAHNAALCWRQSPNRLGNVRSASSNSIPAGNARISILRAGSNARSLFPSGSHVRTSAINVSFIPCGFGWKRKLPRRLRRGLRMRGRRSRISSRSKPVWRGQLLSAYF